MGGCPRCATRSRSKECLEEAYLHGPTTLNPRKIIPNDDELPTCSQGPPGPGGRQDRLLHLPGCPPRADLIWDVLVALVTDKRVELPTTLLKFD
jgi:NAD-reducing hydrogenase small subunit